jgi:hypothetical protein
MGQSWYAAPIWSLQVRLFEKAQEKACRMDQNSILIKIKFY